MSEIYFFGVIVGDLQFDEEFISLTFSFGLLF